MGESDIMLAISVDDLTLLDCAFHTQAPQEGSAAHTRMGITNPGIQFSYDEKASRLVLRSTVDVQFGLVSVKAGSEPSPHDPEFVHFGLTAGVAASVAAPNEAGTPARHNLESALRLEALKAAYSLAIAKLAELSALSPMGKLILPALDTDALLADIQREQNAQA